MVLGESAVSNEGGAIASVAVGAFISIVILPCMCIFLAHQLGAGKVSPTKANTLIFFLLPLLGWGSTLFFQGLYIIRAPPLMNKNSGAHVIIQPLLNYIVIPLRILGVNVSLLRVLICLYGFPKISGGKLHLQSIAAAEKLQMGWMVSMLLLMYIPYVVGFIWQVIIRFRQRSILDVAPEDRAYWVGEMPVDLRHYNIVINVIYLILALVCVYFLWRRRQSLQRFDLDHSKYQATYVFFYGIFLIFANVQNYVEIGRTYKVYMYGVSTPVAGEGLGELSSLEWVNFTVAVLEAALIIVLWVKSYLVASRPRAGHTTDSETAHTKSLQKADTVQKADMFPPFSGKSKDGKTTFEGGIGRPFFSPPNHIGKKSPGRSHTPCEEEEEEGEENCDSSVDSSKREGLSVVEIENQHTESFGSGGENKEDLMTDGVTAPAAGGISTVVGETSQSECVKGGKIGNFYGDDETVGVEGGCQTDTRAVSWAC